MVLCVFVCDSSFRGYCWRWSWVVRFGFESMCVSVVMFRVLLLLNEVGII